MGPTTFIPIWLNQNRSHAELRRNATHRRTGIYASQRSNANIPHRNICSRRRRVRTRCGFRSSRATCCRDPSAPVLVIAVLPSPPLPFSAPSEAEAALSTSALKAQIEDCTARYPAQAITIGVQTGDDTSAVLVKDTNNAAPGDGLPLSYRTRVTSDGIGMGGRLKLKILRLFIEF